MVDKRLLKQTPWLGLTIALGAGWGSTWVVVFFADVVSSILQGVFLEHQPVSWAFSYWPYFVLLVVLRPLLVGIQGFWSAEIAYQVKGRLRRRLLTWIYRYESDGDSVLRLSHGVEVLDAWFARFLPQLFLAVLCPLTLLFVAWYHDWLTGLIFLITAPLLPFFMILIGSRARQKAQQQWKIMTQLSNFFLDTLLGLPTLKWLGLGKSWSHVLQKRGEDFRDTTFQVLKLAFVSALVLELVSTVGTAVVAVEIGLRLLHDQLSLREGLFLLLLVPEFYLPLRLLGQSFHASLEGNEAAQDLFPWLQKKPEEPDSEVRFVSDDHRLIKEQTLLLVVQNLSLRWSSSSRSVFRNTNLTARAGELIWVQGPSGAGKSTLIAGLLGHLPLQTGQIHWKVPCTEMGWLPQHPVIFQRSLRCNLVLQGTEQDDQHLWNILRQVGLEQWARQLPDQLDTLLGEQGSRMSGGQIRRLALARVLYQNPTVLILDEPEGHLDKESAHWIRQTVLSLQSQCRIVISHEQGNVWPAQKKWIWQEHGFVEVV